ncbi:hypothetical protein N7535_008598 [Penicillium sp. DV-2018c]|nr:hypothetical protein N7461_002363 [Penicillium sp. DV-2018c]KAJ5563434.1 hypothetical protein N7535_008598 [Penicillium sp. DV-2018c]
MSTTLITGSSGFVGSTVLAQLLQHGHRVIATVRSQHSADGLLSVHPEWKDVVIFVVVPDFTKPGAFDTVFKEYPGIDYVIHVAAPLLDDPANTDFVEHFEKPSVLGNSGLLTSAHTYGKNVKAIAITGSLNAITTGAAEDVSSRVLGNDQWLPLDRDDAIKLQDSFISYCVGKKVAEKTVWDFVEEKEPSFTVTNFMPPLIFGPMLQKVSGLNRLNFSTNQIYSIMNSADGDGKVPPTAFPGSIDVRDLAAMHIAALTNPAAADKRFVVGQPMLFDEIADHLRKLPELTGRVGQNNGITDPVPRFGVDEAIEVFGDLGRGRPKGETFIDTAKQLLELEQAM